MHANMKAFLAMIGISELGRELIAKSDEGYNVIVGSTGDYPILMANYLDHPRKLMRLNIRGAMVSSTAAGRYQILARYYDAYRVQLKLKDFGKASQDAIAIQLITECKAIADIEAGRFVDAVYKCKSRWASLPGAGYKQNEQPIAYLIGAYREAGGVLA